MDISKVSDEELSKIAGNAPASIAHDISKISDEDLAKIAGTEAKPSLIKNAISDVGDIVKGMPESMGQAASNIGKAGLDVMTGSSLSSMLNPERKTNPITEPSILNMIKGTSNQAVAEEPKYEPKNIGKTLYEHPLQNEIVNAAMLAIPAIFGKVGGNYPAPEGFDILKNPIVKSIGALTPENSLKTSQVLAKMTGVQPSTIEGLADPEIRKYYTPDLALKTNDLEGDIYNSLKELPKGLSKAENQVYKNAGITDETPTVWNKPILGKLQSDGTRGEPITPIDDMRNKIDNFRATATTDELPIANKADEIVNKIIKDSTFDENKNMNLPFGKAKVYSGKLYDLSQDDGLSNQGQRLFGQMYQSAKAAKNSIPEIQKAGSAFSDIEDARDILKNSFRGFGVEGREFRAEKNIFSKYKEDGNIGFKQNMDKVGEILSQHPESKELADFSKKVKVMNAAVDFSKAKMPSNGFVSRLPLIGSLLGHIKPSAANLMSMAKGGVESGRINTEALKGRVLQNTTPFIGSPINKYLAVKSIFSNGVSAPKPSILEMIRGGK